MFVVFRRRFPWWLVSEPDLLPKERQGLKATAFALTPGLIAFSMGQTVLFAVAGPVIRDIGLSEFQLGLIVSAAALVFVIASPIWGRISDRWGRKPVILFGLFTYAIISFAFAGIMDLGLSGTLGAMAVFVSLLGLRFLYAALGTGIQPSSVALMADLSDEENRASAVAIVGAAFGFGMILGPAAAALLVGFGVLVPLYAIAGLGLISGMIAAIFLKPEKKVKTDRKATNEKIDLQPLLPIMFASLCVFTATSALQQTMAFFVQDFLQADAATAARATGICFVAMAVLTLLAQGGLIQVLKPGPGLLLRAGLPIMVLGVVCYALPVSFIQIVIAAALMGLGFGLVNPGLMAAASLRTSSESQGSVAGLMQAMMASGYVVGPLAGTALYEISPLHAAALIGAALLLALIALMFISFKPEEEAIDANSPA
ncbi:MAG: MFS transporter [Pseudomonadota bacterium]